jgi:iron complex outermembrane receptor protein
MTSALSEFDVKRPTVLAVACGLLQWPPAMANEATTAQAEPPAVKDIADMDLTELSNVRVSPFDVSADLDNGYRASNSVSGSRFDTPIRDLPFAIQAFATSFIKDQKPRDIFDIARYSPGVTYRSNDFNEGNANLAIRGFAVSATPGNVQILRDGFHGPSIFDLTNVSRVEVVKGPASFLYGQVAPGGIVNIITKSPQSQFAATADATMGSYGQYRIEADITGPASPTLFYRLAASYDQNMHYWEPYDAHASNFSPSLLWQPDERFSVSLNFESLHKTETPQLMQKPGYNTQAGVVPTASDPNRSGVDVPGLTDSWNSMAYADDRRSDTQALSAWVDFKANEHWNLRTGYSHQAYTVDAIASGNFGMANNATLLQGRRVRVQIDDNRDDTVEMQAVGRYQFDQTSLRLLLGTQYIKRRFNNQAAQAPNDPALGNSPTASPLPLWDWSDPSTWNRSATFQLAALTASTTDQSTHYVDKSIYAGSTFGFFDDRLLVLAGGRSTSTESQLTNHLTGQSVPPITASAVTPQYGVLYKLTPAVSVFGSYAESFVPGAQILNSPDGTAKPAEPTHGDGYDLGLKANLFDGRVSGTLSFFNIRNQNIVNDLAVTDASGAVKIFNVQSGEQRSRGMELDATISLTGKWQMYLSYSLMNARITEFSGNDAAILAQNPALLDAAGQANYKNVLRFHDAPLQMSAPRLFNLWTRYNFSQNGMLGAYMAGGINHVSDQTILPDGPVASHQMYTLLNAVAGYARTQGGRRMSLALIGKNLTHQSYRPSQSTRGRPREFLLTLTARF